MTDSDAQGRVSGHKPRLSRIQRLLGATLDPRVWVHLVKMVNFYNYAHVRQLRPNPSISVFSPLIAATATFALNAGL